MPVPIGKAALTFFRYLLRPINNTLIRKFKAQHGAEKQSLGYTFFGNFGQVCNRFEIALNRIIIQQKGLGEIRAIPADLAFSKGVDYFTEIVFFYMIMFGIAIYEMDKGYRSGKKTAERLDNATKGHANLKTQIEVARTDVNRIKTLQ